jgi:hypothetical protein
MTVAGAKTDQATEGLRPRADVREHPSGPAGGGGAAGAAVPSTDTEIRVASGKDDDKRRVVRPPIATDAEGWATATGLTQREAEELLDWLEANGYQQREVLFASGPGITVRWR